MSHGSVEKCEPNLVPLLDLVLQMIMFFMLCGNFVSEDTNKDVRLPSAIQAKPLQKSEDYVVFLNVDKDGSVLLGRDRSAEKLTNRVQVANYMRTKYELDERRIAKAKERGQPAKPSLVVLRAHESCTYKMVNEVLLGVRQAGYSDVQLRAIVASAKN